ncbi:hypothetical protein [Mucilaginibacter agri]|uniref:Lipoprotein n=1 Tax=Mucilaginibacter agri TaxID=2695265 RepID=A0A965ZH28_9SPHI|nr:hypothetical protein [Mucilaginibacter agri]NCD70580.1 hypothetical protein [Mucilaginibacter agri]
MKKMNLLFIGIAGIISLTACHNRSHRVIAMSNNNTSVRIEYVGDVLFNNEQTGIAAISPHGYVKYERDGRDLFAENRKGKIYYEFNGDDDKLDLNTSERQFVSEAVKDMVKYGHNIKGR